MVTAGQSALSGAPMTPQEPLLTFKEAMGYLRVSRSTLYRLIWAGQLTGHKVGSTWRFYESALAATIRVSGRENARNSEASHTQVLMPTGKPSADAMAAHA